MLEIQLQATIDGRIDDVWALFTDHVAWARWAGVKEVVLRQQGDPAPNGVGAVRVIRDRGVAVEEEVTAFEAPKLLVYRMLAGLPARDYHGEVSLAEGDGDTQLCWSVRFRPLIPGTGWLLGRLLRRKLQDILGRFERYAATAAA